jgi:hypothetical protein
VPIPSRTASRHTAPRAREGTFPRCAPHLHAVHRRLAEGAARVDRHHLRRLAADHVLVVRRGRNTPSGRRDPPWKRHRHREESPWRLDEALYGTWGASLVRRIPAWDEGVAFFLPLSLSGESRMPMEDRSSS